MDQISIDLCQGNQDELAFLDEGMGDLEFLCMNFGVIKKENIEVNRPGVPIGRFSYGPTETSMVFNVEEVRRASRSVSIFITPLTNQS